MQNAVAAETERTRRFEQWVLRYNAPILRTCFIYLTDKTQAEDAAQDTFLKAWKAMEQFEGQGDTNEKAWLMRIAINVCHDYHRSKWFRHVDLSKALEDLPSRYLLTEPEDRTLLLDILCLPEKLKQAVLLYYYQEMTLREAADILGISTSSMHSRLRKAEKLLKITLTGGEDDA